MLGSHTANHVCGHQDHVLRYVPRRRLRRKTAPEEVSWTDCRKEETKEKKISLAANHEEDFEKDLEEQLAAGAAILRFLP